MASNNNTDASSPNPSSQPQAGGASAKLLSTVGMLVVCVFIMFLATSTEIEAEEWETGVKMKQPLGGNSSKDNTTAEVGNLENTIHDSFSPQSENFSKDAAVGNLEDTTKIDEKNSLSPPQSSNSDPAAAPAASPRRTYVPRGRLHVFSATNETIAAQKQAMMDEWGSWTLVDDRERPQYDFYSNYPHRDVPRTEFPSNAWQLDAEYLAKFLPESLALVERAQKAILKEYGQETPDMFRVFRYNATEEPTDRGSKQGGWTTDDSWNGLVKRILHAIVTEDVFTFAMGGHSAAAGHGNHFQQSYTLQIQWILESVFARMGVQHIARNYGNGGLGTIQNGIAAADIYGHDVDMILWDSGMTEKENRNIELFHRQALIAGNYKVPILWTRSEKIARQYNRAAGVDFGVTGSGEDGLNKCSTFEELRKQPYAPRYMRCDGEVKKICHDHRYDGVCWIDRPDVTPWTPQKKNPGGRASWHPGNREHQLFGRVLTYTILEATKDALTIWKNAEGYKLDDKDWHLTEHYKKLRKGLDEMNLEDHHCLGFAQNGMEFMCKYPMKARTEFTPRAFADITNIRSLMPPEMAAHVNNAPYNIYGPPDVFNPSLHPPEGEVDVLSIVEAGVPFRSILAPSYARDAYKKPKFAKPPQVPVGKGVSLSTRAGDIFCDGSLDSFCNRGGDADCLLSAHNDGRNGLKIDGYSGWVVMNIPDLRYGYIVVKFETWHQSNNIDKTEGWTSVNNEESEENTKKRELNQDDEPEKNLSLSQFPLNQTDLSSNSSHRRLKKPPPAICDNFRFEYAINGEVKWMDKSTFQEKRQNLARVVEAFVLLSDPDFTGGVEMEVEVAVRIVGCGRINTFSLSHIYWA